MVNNKIYAIILVIVVLLLCSTGISYAQTQNDSTKINYAIIEKANVIEDILLKAGLMQTGAIYIDYRGQNIEYTTASQSKEGNLVFAPGEAITFTSYFNGYQICHAARLRSCDTNDYSYDGCSPNQNDQKNFHAYTLGDPYTASNPITLYTTSNMYCCKQGSSDYFKVQVSTNVPKTEGKYEANIQISSSTVKMSCSGVTSYDSVSAKYDVASSKKCTPSYIGNRYCEGSTVYQNWVESDCKTITKKKIEDCNYGCSDGECKTSSSYSPPPSTPPPDKTCDDKTEYFCENNNIMAENTYYNCNVEKVKISSCSELTICKGDIGPNKPACVSFTDGKGENIKKPVGEGIANEYIVLGFIGLVFVLLLFLVFYLNKHKKGGRK